MEIEHFASQMAGNAGRIEALMRGVAEGQARWRPTPDSWSILEVINHLGDEEREDFRVRLDYTLHRPGEPWPGIDPGGWVTEREYNQRDLDASLHGFLKAREESLVWLRQLSAPNWEASYEAPWGPIAAGDIFASWVGHDLLHMRQLVELQWLYTTAAIGPYSTEYAGQW